jgi:hypothetical protein
MRNEPVRSKGARFSEHADIQSRSHARSNRIA